MNRLKSYKIAEGRYMITDGDHVFESPISINEDEVELTDKDQPVKTNTESKPTKIPVNIDKAENPDEKPTKENPWFFSNIIMFTNERDPKKNKTLNNLEEAVKGTDVKIHVFIADEVTYKATDSKITINDLKEEYVIDKQSNIDTIVIARLGMQDSEECMSCVKELQEWGLFVLNPAQAAEKASNKYESAVLMERHKIPQPRFCLIDKSDLRDGEKSLNKKLKVIYEEAGKEDGKEEREYVVKILNGHGGTGVFMTNEKQILAILQFVFAIDEERELLVQRKENADGGDIRVHVLTSRTKQKILASMKRVKISGDFRSNVSLGAEAEKVELTEEQKNIALKTAKASGMPWCAVDIMPLKTPTPDGYKDVVLEYNASPGTDGISEVIGKNFCNVLLDAINDINELVLQPKQIGYKEDITIYLTDNDKYKAEAKFDTGNGAKASTIGCDKIEIDGDNVYALINGSEYTFKKHGMSYAKVGQHTEDRTTVIIPRIKIGTRQLLDVEFALVDNRDKSTEILLNRDVMGKMAYLVNPGKKHTLDKEHE